MASHSPTRAATLDEAFERVIKSVRVTELAEVSGFPLRQLYHWSCPQENPSGEHRDPPAKVIEPLSRITGRLDILEYLSTRLGCVLIQVPRSASSSGLALIERVAMLTKEFAEVQTAAAEVFCDGRISRSEAALIDDAIHDLVREAETLRHSVLERATR